MQGLSWQQDIGMVAEMAAHDDDAPCFVFEDVPGTIKGSRVLVNFFAGKRKNMTLGFPTDLSKVELSEGFRVHYAARHEAHPAEIRRHRPGDAERHDRRRDRRHQIPGAAMAPARTAAAISAPAATTSCAIRTTAGSIAAPTAS